MLAAGDLGGICVCTQLPWSKGRLSAPQIQKAELLSNFQGISIILRLTKTNKISLAYKELVLIYL